jgi:hypothetical protein
VARQPGVQLGRPPPAARRDRVAGVVRRRRELGGLVAVVVWIAPAAGKKLYVGWMLAAQPIGWTISHLVLAAVYYLVLTPIGLLMRLFGRDPMQRHFDRSATSYWVKRPTEADPSRHFRQF